MSIFDIFTGNPYKAERDRISEYAGQLESNYGNLYTGLAQDALNDLSSLTNQGASAITDYGNAGIDALTGYTDLASQALNTGRDQAVGELDRVLPYLDPYLQSGMSASTMLTNALGLNGADGNTAATNAFQAGPGYQWQVDQATDAAARKASALGIGASGNTLAALTELGSNLANQEYGSWLDRLTGQQGVGMQATGMLGDIQSQKAGYNWQNGAGQADLMSGLGSGISSIYGNMGSGLANLYGNQANTQAGIRTGLGDDLWSVGQYTSSMLNDANKQAADAKTQASGNIWSGVTGLLGGIF